MGFRRTHTWARQTGAALFVVTLASSTAFGQGDSGAVFVGDMNPSAVAESSGPSLPSLSPQAMTPGMPRPIAMPAPRSVPPSIVRAGYMQQLSDQAPRAEAKKASKRPLFSRLMQGFGRGETTPEPAPVAPREFGVQQVDFSQAMRGAPSSRAGGITEGVGSRQPRGLFEGGKLFSGSQQGSSSSSKSQPRVVQSRGPSQRSASNRALAQRKPSKPTPPVAVARGPVFNGTRGSQPMNMPKAMAAAPAAKKLSPEPMSEDGAVFVGDSPQIASSSPKPQATPAVEVKPNAGGARPILKAVEPAPVASAMPMEITTAPPAVVAEAPMPAVAPTPSKTINKATKTREPAPTKVAENPVPPATKEEGPSERAAGLLVEASTLAGSASTDAEFTNIIKRCRHVLAIDNSPAGTKYARELGSWALNKRGEMRADAGQNVEAMTDFDDALTMDPKRWRAVHNRGVLLAQSGAYAEAFDCFNDTLKLNPKFAKAYSNRASLYVLAGDFDAAVEDYTSAIAHDPDLATAHKGQGRVCHMLGRMQQALRHLDAATLLTPEDASVVVCRSDLLVDMGRYAEAIAGYRRAIELDSNSPSAYRNLAWLQATCPDRRFLNTDHAILNAQRSMQLAGAEDDISLDTLAAAQAASGDFQAATETIRRAMELAPASDRPVYAERLSLYESGQPFVSEPVGEVHQAGYEHLMK